MQSSHSDVTRMQGGNLQGHNKNHQKATTMKDSKKKKAAAPRKTIAMTSHSSRRRSDHPSCRMHKSRHNQTQHARLGHGGRFARSPSTLWSSIVSGRSEEEVCFP
ncbi:hypothetical protein E2562_012240 [Oryza meyeriana var. granulata]|uniref:Uncharacterized protein n=1 Tax=Oryza meyeriana var. granulata TaxID=110450 RepID=A0A6G1D1A3_9ORYZ|nr:hypothetical protein E2562_012240 [Oryza meyeriana var. granulata]